MQPSKDAALEWKHSSSPDHGGDGDLNKMETGSGGELWILQTVVNMLADVGLRGSNVYRSLAALCAEVWSGSERTALIIPILIPTLSNVFDTNQGDLHELSSFSEVSDQICKLVTSPANLG